MKVSRDRRGRRRVAHFRRAAARLDEELSSIAGDFPETEALTDIRGIGLYSALFIVAEFGEPWRFKNARQAAAYTGLTSRVWQSGSREGSPWLRWILVEAAMKVVRRDEALRNFHTRIRKRAGWRRARVAVARKLAEICCKRLCRWHDGRRAA